MKCLDMFGLHAELEKGMGVLGHLASKVSSSSLRCAPSQATLAPPTSLNNVKSDLLMVWICFFLMTTAAEHLFMYLLAICTSSLEKYLFESHLYPFLNWVAWLLSCVSSLHILDINSLSDT